MGILPFVLLSCSVKEERRECPSFLTVDASAFGSIGRVIKVKALPNLDGSTETDASADKSARFDVPRSMIRVYTYTSAPDYDTVFLVEEGCQADSLYTFEADVDCAGERSFVRAVPHKQFATVILGEKTLPDEPEVRYNYVVDSDFYGIDIKDMTPQPGRLHFYVPELSDCFYIFRLPRHDNGNALTIQVMDRGRMVYELPLGRWLEQFDYDWKARDLADISIGLDYARGDVNITISGWEDGGSYAAEI